MTGKQANFGVLGAQNEAVAHDLIGRLSAPVKVPREHDFGADYFCQLYTTEGTASVGTDQLFALQVKGMSEELSLGGLRGETWFEHEVAWLRTLAVPLVSGRVDSAAAELHLYSLGPIWRVLWKTPTPFRIRCSTEPPTPVNYVRPDPVGKGADHDYGDRQTWHVPLGPPLLRLTHASLADQAKRSSASDLLRWHVQLERRNLLRYQLSIAVHECLSTWSTDNETGKLGVHKEMSWSPVPGDNIGPLASTLGPAIANLAVNLQWQNNHAAYRFVDALEWLNEVGALDAAGRGLLEGLLTTRSQGLGPSEPGPTSE